MRDPRPEGDGAEEPADLADPADLAAPTRLGALVDYGGGIAFSLWTALAFLRPGRLVVSFDTVAYSGPNMAFNRQQLLDGRIPQWNDSIFGGVPQLGNIHAGALYPVRALLAVLPIDPIRATNWVAAIHVVLLAAGLVLLVRQLGLRAPAGLVATMAVLGSGMLSSRSLQLEQLIGLAWLPWLLAAVDRTIDDDRRTRWSVPAVAGVTAMLLTGGHAQSTFAGVATAAVFGVARSLDRSIDRQALTRLVRPAIGAALGGLLAAPQLLPTLSLAGRASTVSQRTLEELSNPDYVLLFSRSVSAVFGDGTAPNQAVVTGNFEAATAVGVVACCLALLGVVLACTRRPDRATRLVLGAVALGGFLLALGPRTVLYRTAFEVVPGLDSARVPGRWRDLTVIGVALLAAYGIDALARAIVDRRTAIANAALVGAGTLFIATYGFVLPGRRVVVLWLLAAAVVTAIVALAWYQGPRARTGLLAGLATAALGAEMVFLGPPIAWGSAQPDSVDDTTNPVTEFLADQPERSFAFTTEDLGDTTYVLAGMRPNANSFLGVRSIDGYDGGVQVTDDWVAATAALENPVSPDLLIRHQLRLPMDPELFARFGVRWVLYDTSMLPLPDLAPGWGDPVVESGGLAVLDNPAYEGEAHLFAATHPLADDEAPGDALADDDESGEAAVVEADGPVLDCDTSCAPQGVEVRRSRPGALDLSADAARASVLVVDEQFDPGWSATVDGASVEVFKADGMFLGLQLPAGAHEVRLRYTAPGLRVGLALFVLGGLGLVAWVVVAGNAGAQDRLRRLVRR